MRGGDDKTARLWDAPSGQQIGPALQHRDRVLGAQFSRDESRILTWSADNTARLWIVSADYDFPSDQLKTWLQAVTGAEFDPATRQVKVIEPARWRSLQQTYNRIAAEHAAICKYPEANQWLAFQSKDKK